ncbi:MAG: PadR family transcriptional regulator, partial [Akkermansiaceae bacterium]|nr:PadR family transcriptional regulator [Armatimonadota bacterium]
MSSIRLFILSSFAELGPMHGHRLRLEAEHNHVHLWTDISVGAVYGAMKRLASEGLLRESGREREGNRPTRQLYEITAEGHLALATLRKEGLRDVWFKYDPFDLALTRTDPGSLDTLPSVVAER